jgi:deoxyribodipyrimidine photo-lyase
MQPVSVFWFRRDLRLHDNAGLYHALKSGMPVLPIFIFDPNILDQLEDKMDKRVDFIHQQLLRLHDELKKCGSSILILSEKPIDAFKRLVSQYPISSVYTNHDYEPYAISRDQQVSDFLKSKEIAFATFKDQCIFEKNEILKNDGKPYTIFTPYSKAWKAALKKSHLDFFATEKYFRNLLKTKPFAIPSLKKIGFAKTGVKIPPLKISDDFIRHYHETRDIPGIRGTTHSGIHLRFGTISIRELARKAKSLNETFLNELIWREFYMMILFHFPEVVDHSFRSAFEFIVWRNNEMEFQLWCEGKTGVPIVDAGMRELNETGFMHNRIRMMVASFLTKDLLIDWRWGEAYFAKKLFDYELSSNNGNWQWAASTGCDAVPYFRIFNPEIQTKKLDPELKYIRKWIPEVDSPEYPEPIVDHRAAKQRALKVYKAAFRKQN